LDPRARSATTKSIPIFEKIAADWNTLALIFSARRIPAFWPPAACRLPKIGCRCIRGPHFLHEDGLVKEIKAEHIDPASFFNEGE
jgi:hypothetical protein